MKFALIQLAPMKKTLFAYARGDAGFWRIDGVKRILNCIYAAVPNARENALQFRPGIVKRARGDYAAIAKVNSLMMNEVSPPRGRAPGRGRPRRWWKPTAAVMRLCGKVRGRAPINSTPPPEAYDDGAGVIGGGAQRAPPDSFADA